MSGSEMPAVPLARTYWVQRAHFLAGAYPGSADPRHSIEKIGSIVGAGIRCFVNLMEEIEIGHDGTPISPYEEMLSVVGDRLGVALRMERIPIRDVCVPTTETMTSILNVIDAAIAGGEPVYVHCWGGRGRTGTVVGCWLIRHNYADSTTALDMIRQLRANVPDRSLPSPETAEQEAMILGWRKRQ